MFDLELLAQAEIEMSDSYDWYNGRQFGLGDRFYKEINHYLEVIASNPYLFNVRYAEDIRTAALKVFPYLIIYWIDEAKQIVYVTSIFNTSREPQY